MKMLADGVSAMKFLTAAKITHSNKMEDLSREFWKRIYKTHEEFGFSEGLHKVCETVGINKDDAQKIIDESPKESIQVKLNETMKRAVDYGGFGVPTILVENPEDESKPEMFFGSDRCHLIARYLGVECHSPGNCKDH
ncbi:Glutathione S-transferase kappa 1 [Paramuricea clavata]|uniref:Glutathione S-transferase kappa 1, partial n=1 Tax=Paramuricea clavata TaxID=317549 RepID=A0A7D9DRD4_PARCT|nr:Glutathione S-transferase kappa 1 [Paramuricea clavata]